MTTEPVRLSKSDGVARITLDDPDKRNAVTIASSQAFLGAVRQAVTDADVKVIVLRGTGDFFSVGGDIDEFLAHETDMAGHVITVADNIHAGIGHLVKARAPVIVGLNGIAAGGGVGIMLSGDIVIAKASARINSGYTRSGLTPDAGLTWFLPRLIGHARAFDFMAFNEFMSAQQAQDLGIVSRVVEDADFDAEIERTVERLKSAPGNVLGETKRLLRQAASTMLESQLEAEAQSIARQVQSADTIAKISTFRKK